MLFTFPSRYWFAIGGREYLALGDGPPGFPQDSSCPAVLGCPPNETTAFRLPDFHRLWSDFPDSLAKQMVFLLAGRSADQPRRVPQPQTCNACRLITHIWFRLFRFRSPLLTESLLFSFRPATKMFQFAGCPPAILWIQMAVPELILLAGYPIRIPPDHRLIAAPRGVSPLAASFFGPLPQGIHRAPFVA